MTSSSNRGKEKISTLSKFEEYEHPMFNFDYEIGLNNDDQEEQPPTQESNATTGAHGRLLQSTPFLKSSTFVKYFDKVKLSNRKMRAKCKYCF